MSITVFRVHPETLIFLYSEQVLQDDSSTTHVPGNCIVVTPPETTEQQLLRWNSSVPRTHHTFGTETTGSWEVLADYRKVKLYTTHDGQEYTVGADIDIDGTEHSFDGVGDLPDWLTEVERPSPFHNWTDSAWIPDEDAIAENEKQMERAWRDSTINRFTWIRDRHRDEQEQGIETSITESQYSELLLYFQDLRDWPQQSVFPKQSARPVEPEWLAAI